MARLNVLEYKADFIRGWPHGEAVEMNYPSALPLGNGDIAYIVSSGQIAKITPPTGTETAVTPIVIARGQLDTFAGGGTGRGNLYETVVPNIGILSNYVVRTSVVSSVTPPIAGQAPVIITETVNGVADTPVWSNNTASAYWVVDGAMTLETEVGIKDADGGSIANAAVILVK